jgi:hypothetical protein
MSAGFTATLQIDPGTLGADPLLGVAAALVAAALAGEAAARAFGLSRVVGYAAVGLGLAWTGADATDPLPGGVWRVVVDLALGLLLFELGSRVRLRWLRDNPPLAASALLGAVAGGLAIYLALRAAGTGATAAAALAALLLPSCGGVIARVAAELRPGGQVGERMRVGAVVDTAVAVVALALLIGWLHVERAGEWVPALAQPLYTFTGSAALAAALAAAVGGLARRIDLRHDSASLLLFGLVVLAVLLARPLGLSTLLVPLAAGVLLRNLGDRVWIWPRHFGSAGGVLVLLMFVAVGRTASWPALLAGAGAAAVALAARLFAKGALTLALAPAGGLERRQALALTSASLPVSATSLVLWAELQRTHAAVAAEVAPVLLSALTLMALLGPLAVQWALRYAGEVVVGGARRDGARDA